MGGPAGRSGWTLRVGTRGEEGQAGDGWGLAADPFQEQTGRGVQPWAVHGSTAALPCKRRRKGVPPYSYPGRVWHVHVRK